jgi:hypothetical protein
MKGLLGVVVVVFGLFGAGMAYNKAEAVAYAAKWWNGANHVSGLPSLSLAASHEMTLTTHSIWRLLFPPQITEMWQQLPNVLALFVLWLGALRLLVAWWRLVRRGEMEGKTCTPLPFPKGISTSPPHSANFVSQCLLAGGHAKLVKSPCRGYPCGKEEVGALKLANCLVANYGWVSTCGHLHAPPSNIAPGDVLIYHKGSCSDGTAHATLVTSTSGGVKITCHSTSHHNIDYKYQASAMPYYQWLHHS